MDEKKPLNIKFRDMQWVVLNAEKEAEKSERLATFSLGFSVFTLVFIMFVELVIKKLFKESEVQNADKH